MGKFPYIKQFIFGWLVGICLVSCGINKSLKHRPDVSVYNADIPGRIKINDSTFTAGNSFLTKNTHGQWELYVEGDPLEIGLLTGSLTQELMYTQEQVFFEKINELVPSKGKQKFLRKFLSWYNRKLYKHVPERYQAEIYGVSRFASKDFDAIATPYLRSLYLHGAHDIGHALQDLALVGCTSFAAWNEKTSDGELLIGRNFDFYAGDAFAEHKIIAFVNPDEGHQFMSVTWGGFIGVVSGMNEKGLTVTINAGKSKIPFVAKTPISIVAREILQYAATVDEAIAIAKKREVFVSEAIMIGSAIDHTAVLIEVSPNNFGVYEVGNSNELICSNHFQSEAFKDDRRNLKTIENSHSAYRYARMEELLSEESRLDPAKAVAILRNTKGLNDTTLGYGNEKAINQLLAHHGVVFQPEALKVWVSSNPYQLGEFVAYDLNTVFRNREDYPSKISVSDAEDIIAEDPFIHSEAFQNYQHYRSLERHIEQALEAKETISNQDLNRLIAYNPDYWKPYFLVGTYQYQQRNYTDALKNFEIANGKEVTTVKDAKELRTFIKKSKRKAK
ncbi:MAG TPA: C45 family peptidase [Aquaticitalea sp.]|nr:C45 family peptidase [Aquaticitalea sp.]